MGYGRADSRATARVFQWNFPLLGTYWTAADILIQHIAKKEGGFDKLKGKKIALRLSRLALRQGADRAARGARRRCTASSFTPMPGARIPASSRRRTWLQIRQQQPGLRAAVGLGRDELRPRSRKRQQSAIPRDKMFGVWWSGAEPDVRAGRRRRQGLQRADAAARRRPVRGACRTSRSTSTTRARALAKPDEIGRCSTTAA